eukprot:GHUV01019165.1.p1 GENE.GHUV01019165.1~~GHUV01019165.1.p1  ORF type:complete len:117 (-),score=18.35 GHUV01019165.1:816-1166(-)
MHVHKGIWNDSCFGKTQPLSAGQVAAVHETDIFLKVDSSSLADMNTLSCCRARLSYEQFSQFLVAIKDLNAGRATREDTLAAARQLFGPGNSDLYGELWFIAWQLVLCQHVTYQSS